MQASEQPKNPPLAAGTGYAALISECDATLSMLRKHWMEAHPDNKADWMGRINSVLDRRLDLMAARDRAA